MFSNCINMEIMVITCLMLTSHLGMDASTDVISNILDVHRTSDVQLNAENHKEQNKTSLHLNVCFVAGIGPRKASTAVEKSDK